MIQTTIQNVLSSVAEQTASACADMPMRQLCGLLDGFKAAADAFRLRANEPRNDEAASGAVMDAWTEAMDEVADTIIREIERRGPEDPWSIGERARVLLQYKLVTGEGLRQVSEMADIMARLEQIAFKVQRDRT